MTFDIQHFENSAKQNGIRYWWAHEFMLELGYESWPTFNNVINKAIASCARLGLDVSDAFIASSYSEGNKTTKSYRLTRFACLLITMHADGKKPFVAQAKAALAGIASQLIEAQINQQGIGRIEVREDLKAAEGLLNHAAATAGVENNQFGIFKDAGFRGMYNMSLRDLKQHKGIDEKATAYDFMGLTELAGNLFRVTQTAERLKQQPNVGLNIAAETAKSVGKEVRGMMIKNSGVSPEALPFEENINQVKRQLKNTAKETNKLDAPKKTKKHKQ